MRRWILALVGALLMIGTLAGPALAADDPEPREPWCIDGVEVRRWTDDVTRNRMVTTVTTECVSPIEGNITYQHEVEAYWVVDRRGNGRYIAPADVKPAGPYIPGRGR